MTGRARALAQELLRLCDSNVEIVLASGSLQPRCLLMEHTELVGPREYLLVADGGSVPTASHPVSCSLRIDD